MAREASVIRKTKETDIKLTLNLDGIGKSDISTGVGFFDHMLEGFSKHGFFDLEINACGDIEVDYHHTMEDLGIVLGDAINQALGDRAQINRYGSFLLPMDETLAQIAEQIAFVKEVPEYSSELYINKKMKTDGLQFLFRE